MKLTVKENFEISQPYGAMQQNVGDYPTLKNVLHLPVTSADMNDQHRRVLTLRLGNEQSVAVNVDAKNEVARQVLVNVEQEIQRNFLGKPLEEILESEHGLAEKIG